MTIYICWPVQGFLSSTCPVPPAARDKLRAHGSLLPTFSSLQVLDWAMGMRHLPKPLVALSIAAGLDRVSFVRSLGTHGGRDAPIRQKSRDTVPDSAAGQTIGSKRMTQRSKQLPPGPDEPLRGPLGFFAAEEQR